MYLLLTFDILVLSITSLILIRNYFTFESIRPDINVYNNSEQPLVSICIPARNEENNIRRCIESVITQTYSNIEICVLNDQSTDSTEERIHEVQLQYPDRIRLFQGVAKPEDWMGKPWACHQLSQQAKGEILLFLDADVWLQSDIVDAIVQQFDQYHLDSLTVWPQQITRSFWEKTLIPLLYYVLLVFLVTDYVTESPRWIPPFLRSRLSTLFAAANGQLIAFTRTAYEKINGHQSVKNEIVEDVELARRVRKNKLCLRMFHGVDAVYCRMYENEKEIKNGFRKNFLAGFQFNLPLFISAALFHAIVYIIPYVGLLAFLLSGNNHFLVLSLIAAGLAILHRLILAQWFKWEFKYAFTHIFGILWFEYLGILSIFDYLFDRKVHWKERPVKLKNRASD